MSGGRWKRKKPIVIALVTVLLVGGLWSAWFIRAQRFVTTDNAQVDGDKIVINAPDSGRLVRWEVDEGSSIRRDQVLGEIQMPGAFVGAQRKIRAPERGNVAWDGAVSGSYVQAGDRLAVAYAPDRVFVTARVDGTDIADVRVGAPVNMDVDAFAQPVLGVVQEIQPSTAGEFSLFPQANTTGQFQKVTQVIPVKIALTATGGAKLVPGMNVTVHIRKVSARFTSTRE